MGHARLQFNPEKRLRVEEALGLMYLAQLHCPEASPPQARLRRLRASEGCGWIHVRPGRPQLDGGSGSWGRNCLCCGRPLLLILVLWGLAGALRLAPAVAAFLLPAVVLPPVLAAAERAAASCYGLALPLELLDVHLHGRAFALFAPASQTVCVLVVDRDSSQGYSSPRS